MKLNNFSYKKELNLATKAILEATKKITFKGIEHLKVKRDKTIATNVDENVEKYIINKILAMFPNDNFVSEEENANNQLKNRSWIIDPIDGTNTFVKGYPNWGTQLAFFVDNDIKFSIIYIPKYNEMYVAVKNNGVWVNGKKVNKPASNALNMCCVEWVGKLCDKLELKTFADLFMHFNGKVMFNQYIWGACIDFTNLVSGKCDTLISSVQTAWDFMPGEFMLKEQGATIIEFNNIVKIYTFSKNYEKEVKKLIKGNK